MKEIRDAKALKRLAPWVTFGRSPASYATVRKIEEWSNAAELRLLWFRAINKGDTTAADMHQAEIARNPWPETSLGKLKTAFGQWRAAVSDFLIRDGVALGRQLTPGYSGQLCEPGSSPEKIQYFRDRHRLLTERVDTDEQLKQTPVYAFTHMLGGNQYGTKPVSHRVVVVNLHTPDDVLIQAFSNWLANVRSTSLLGAERREAGMTTMPTRKSGATASDMRSWTDDRLMAIVDYTLAARQAGLRATDSAMGKAISKTSSAVQKSLRPRAMRLISDEVVMLLCMQAAVAIESPARPTKKPRGLSARAKPRAV